MQRHVHLIDLVSCIDLVKSFRTGSLFERAFGGAIWLNQVRRILVARGCLGFFFLFEKDRTYLLACFDTAEDESLKVRQKVVRHID